MDSFLYMTVMALPWLVWHDKSPFQRTIQGEIKQIEVLQVGDAGILHSKKTACYLSSKNADEAEALRCLLWTSNSMLAC